MTTDQGVSALEQAVNSGQKMVEVFLNAQTSEVGKTQMFQLAILYSIKRNDMQLLEYLLDQKKHVL